jgi:L-lactate dehydrogenase
VRDLTLALPRLVGGQGVLETFPQPLDPPEMESLRESASILRKALHELGGEA